MHPFNRWLSVALLHPPHSLRTTHRIAADGGGFRLDIDAAALIGDIGHRVSPVNLT